MNTPLYGIVLKVKNLELMRFFYRDVLELGAPQSDSNFWVEFNLGEGVPLILEKAVEDEALPDSSGRVSWIFKVEDLDAVVERLKLFGYDPKHESTERVGFRLYEFHDPEGNPFLVSANAFKRLQ